MAKKRKKVKKVKREARVKTKIQKRAEARTNERKRRTAKARTIIRKPVKLRIKVKPRIKERTEQARKINLGKERGKTKTKSKIIETYNVTADKVTATINITETNGKHEYKVNMPELSEITKALLNEIRNSIVSEVVISSAEVLDPAALEGLKKKFWEKAEQLIEKKVPQIKQVTKHLLVGRLMHEMLGLDKIEFLLADVDLEEIVITSKKEPVRVYHKKYKWVDTNIILKSEEEIINYSNIIARRVGRQITTLNPLLDAHLTTGDRANAILYPISTKGNTITIRKFRRDPWTVTDLIKNNTCSADIFALIWLAIEYEMNILFSGGTASGKTTFLNVCMPFIPTNHRIISIEDTRELMLPETLYWAPLVTRQPNPEGKGEVTMLDLLVNSLRMRPDRIVVGEIRRQREAEVLFEAMHTGHSVYATVHADTAAETISRLTHPPISVPPNLLEAVHLNIVLYRDRRKGVRRILQVSEFIADEDRVTPNIIFRYKPILDKTVEHMKSMRFYDEIGRHTGMSINEISKDLGEKKRIIMWMVKNDIRGIEQTSKIMNLYYSDKEKLISVVNQNKKFSGF